MDAKRDASAQVDRYLSDKPLVLQDVARRLRELVARTVPGARETVNPWGYPTFEFHGDLCYFMIGKSHVTFGFPRGTSLDDPHRLLEGTGKNMRHVKLRKAEDLDHEGLLQLIQVAAKLNRESPATGMRPSARKATPRQQA